MMMEMMTRTTTDSMIRGGSGTRIQTTTAMRDIIPKTIRITILMTILTDTLGMTTMRTTTRNLMRTTKEERKALKKCRRISKKERRQSGP